MSKFSDRMGEVRSGGTGRTYAIIIGLVVLAFIYPEIVFLLDAMRQITLACPKVPPATSERPRVAVVSR